MKNSYLCKRNREVEGCGYPAAQTARKDSRSDMATTLYILRHGETEENVRHVLQGTMPGQLTPRGREQAREAARTQLARIRFDCLVASDLRRCRQTADEIRPFLQGHPEAHFTPLLRERDWGAATGQVIDPAHPIRLPDDMETIAHLRARARQFLDEMEKRHGGQTVLAVSHGFFLRILQCVHYDKELKEVVPMTNAEVRRIELG